MKEVIKQLELNLYYLATGLLFGITLFIMVLIISPIGPFVFAKQCMRRKISGYQGFKEFTQ